MDCLFCKIIAGEIPSEKAYEEDRVYVFHDIEPQAPTHLLVVPRQHIEGANDITEDNAALVGHIFTVIARLADELGIAKDGYRVVNNCGRNGLQSVNHLHFHLLAGRQMQWPPG